MNHNAVIIGAGPVGLFLGLRLHQLGYSFKILEEKDTVDMHSRAIGIHPPSMERLHLLGIADRISELAVHVETADVYIDKKKISTLSFLQCKKPFNFITVIPQSMTEKALEEELVARCPGCVDRGIKGFDFKTGAEKVTVNVLKSSGKNESVTSDFLLACDGKNSSIRESLGIQIHGKYYKDCYIMGDFRDDTVIGSKAIIFLSRHGVVESFPLPGKKRRWVIKTEHFDPDPKPASITGFISERTGYQVESESATMASGFRTQGLIAEKLAKGRIILAGDAAHVTSPIGGQGMNMGWLNAWRLAEVVDHCLKNRRYDESAVLQYEKEAKAAAKRVIKRAEFNMFLGRKCRYQTLRRLVVQFMTDTPIRSVFARNFTMRRIT